MTPDLFWLACGALLFFVHYVAYALPALARNGLGWAVGSRDTEPKLGVVDARLRRAAANYYETFPLFAVGVILAHLAGAADAATALAAQVYVWARLAYIPLYATGWPWARSIVWVVATAAILVIYWAVLT